MQGERGVVGGTHGIFYGTADTHLADVGVGGVVVDIQSVAGLQEHLAVGVEVDANVLHLITVGEVAAEDVGHGEYVLLEAVGILDGLADGHAVVEAEVAGKRVADFAVDGDGLHVAERGQVKHANHVAGL